MKITLGPKNRMGLVAVMLVLLFVVLMVFKFGLFGLPMILPFPSPAIALLGIAGFIIGLIAVIKNKDRSILTFLAILIGTLVLVWVGAEILFPH